MNRENKTFLLQTIQDSNAALSIFDLSEKTGVDIGEAQTDMNALCAEGLALLTKKGRYTTPERVGLIAARTTALRNGTPLAHPLNGDRAMKVKRHSKLHCLPEDIVLVRSVNTEECELAAIVHRGRSEIAAFVRVEQREQRRAKGKHSKQRATVSEKQTIYTAIPCDRRIPYSIVLTGDSMGVRNDQIALIAIDSYPEGQRPIFGHVVRVLGHKSDMHARLQVIAESHGFSADFSNGVVKQADHLPSDLLPEDYIDRNDLRELTAFTIDGPFSKDFDDAVSLEKLPSGDWQLGVHIADVSHYVRPGSAIDKEALERGTSLYLPGLTVPMLPESLSNDLCSLLPNTDRLAMSLLMTIRGNKIVDHSLSRSVIRSHARLTYDAVNRLFDGDDTAVPSELHGILHDMLELSHRLRSARFSHGCIELDLPETEFTLNEENVPIDVFSAPHGEAERLIEDFMLAANETIAALAQATSTPIVYRVHENPDSDKLRELSQYLAGLDVQTHFGEEPHPGILQRVLEDTKDHPCSDSIRRMLLRSLKRAQYSERPLGHYALALDDYCHFTSPIRRYPDLIVHRMIKRLIDGQSCEGKTAQMASFAVQSTEREQAATLAEREASDLMKARFMQDRVGRKFKGVISGITGWGFYVTLENTVEGLVHIATLNDYYEFDRDRNQLVASGSRHVFRLGDKVIIRVAYVDLDRAEIDFEFLAMDRNKPNNSK